MITQQEIDAFNRELTRMQKLGSFAKGIAMDTLTWGNLSVGWAANAPTHYVRARTVLETAEDAMRREVDEIDAQLATLSAAPAPLGGSGAAADLARRVRDLEAQRARLNQQRTRVQGFLATATPAMEAVAKEGAQRVCRALFARAQQEVEGLVQDRLQAAQPQVRNALQNLERIEGDLKRAETILGVPLTTFDLVLPERAAWKQAAEAAPVCFERRQLAERKKVA